MWWMGWICVTFYLFFPFCSISIQRVKMNEVKKKPVYFCLAILKINIIFSHILYTHDLVIETTEPFLKFNMIEWSLRPRPAPEKKTTPSLHSTVCSCPLEKVLNGRIRSFPWIQTRHPMSPRHRVCMSAGRFVRFVHWFLACSPSLRPTGRSWTATQLALWKIQSPGKT